MSRSRGKTIYAADLFCGAGGFSTGLMEAAKELELDVQLLAVNHWDVAIATHSQNHPGVRHYCESLDGVDPRKVVPGGRLHILMASPECTHHSNARGGRPMSDQSRSTAWHILRWAEALYIDNILIENVREFRDWGPLGVNGRPLKSKRGSLYRQFISSLRTLGYTVSDEILNAANYGDATTRRRLFIQARKGRRQISWPEPSHVAPVPVSLFGDDSHTWRPAREIIDWRVPGQSIYNRKRPLSPNTMRRIMAGLEKYSGLPFIVPQFSSQNPRSLESPLGSLTTTSRGVGLCEPYLVVLRNHMDGRSIDRPLPTLAAMGQHIALAQPFLVKSYTGSDAASLDRPLPTVCANYEHLGLAEPILVNMKGKSIGRSVNDPAPTITAHAPHLYLAEPYIVSYHGNHQGKSDGDGRVQTVDRPLQTLDTSNRYAVAQPFLVKYHGADHGAHSIDEPLDTISTRDRYALVSPELVHEVAGEVVGWLDIRFRMLQPHELAKAMSFPDGYKFAGNREAQVKQIGNAVPVRMAAALCKSMLV